VPSSLAILSFQSSVAYGHVGNAAAVFCLRRSGHEIWPVDTVAFSNHPGYGDFGGHVRQAAEVAEIVDGLERLGVPGRCRAVLSGYLGSAAVGRVVLQTAARVKAANPQALFCCDPVMGDRDEGLYVPDDLATLLTDEAAGAADVLVPNHFELEVLAGRPLSTLAEVVAAADRLRVRGCRVVVVTSLATGDGDAGTITNLVVTGSGAWTVTTPKLALAAKGAGDALAALFLGRYLDCGDAADALAGAVSSVYAVIEATAAAGARELLLVASQSEIAAPTRRFRPCRLSPSSA
jgi:pyridoxine kinase